MKGNLYVLSAPAGGGKTTIANKLLEELPFLRRIVTYTTRNPRPGEKNGIDYIFKTKEEFEKLIEEDAFLEHAIVHGHYYGTPKKEVFELLDQGFDVLLIIDVQGMRQVKNKYPETIGIFILPPSWDELMERMKKRGDSEEDIKRRLETAKKEIPAWKEYDYVVINDDLEKAKNKIKCIIISNRQRTDKFDFSLIKDEKLKKLMQNS